MNIKVNFHQLSENTLIKTDDDEDDFMKYDDIERKREELEQKRQNKESKKVSPLSKKRLIEIYSNSDGLISFEEQHEFNILIKIY